MTKTSSIVTVMLCASVAWAAPGQSGQTASYAGQEQREIKAISAEEVQGLLDGKGLGFAKTAELNHYPGPKHVLELAEALQLSARQKEDTHKIFTAMQTEAKKLGAAYVEKERELERLFASGEIRKDTLQSMLDQIGRLQAELRRVHLQAHLEQKAVLTAAQVASYDQLRGYHAGGGSSGQNHSHQH